MTDLINEAKDVDEEQHTDMAIQKNQQNNHLSAAVNKDDDDLYHKMEPDFALSDLLEHHIGFDAFMMHLIKEFSMECLLSYIEFIQFIEFIMRKCPDVHNEDIFILVRFPSSVPLSHIITQNEVITSQHNISDNNNT
eukprot:140261_1